MIGRVLTIYIARRFTATLMLILLAIALIIFLAEYVDVLQRHSDEEGLTAFMGVYIAAISVPFLFDTALPFAFLFAALISLLGLSRKLELVVARASGVSAWGFLKGPALVALFLGACATAALNPIAVDLNEQSQNLRAEISGRATWGGGHWFRQEGPNGSSIVYAASSDLDTLDLFGVTAFVFDGDSRLREKVTAKSARFDNEKWLLSEATVVSGSKAPSLLASYELPTTLTTAEVRRSFVEPEAISFWSLPGFITTAERMGVDPDRFRVELHKLLSRPLFFVAMVLVAAAVSLRLTRFGGIWRLLLTGAGIGFLLYAFSEIASDLGANGIIDPVLAAWLPALVALTFGATALLYLEDG
jgi:lipopolysaccharide export system permease protein